jgi:hypothetical protein
MNEILDFIIKYWWIFLLIPAIGLIAVLFHFFNSIVEILKLIFKIIWAIIKIPFQIISFMINLIKKKKKRKVIKNGKK